MKAFFSYKIILIVATILLGSYGGYRGVVAFQNYEANQINAAVQMRTNQFEQQLALRAASSLTQAATTTTSSTVDARVSELETEIGQLKAAQSQSAKASNNSTKISTLQKQVTALKTVASSSLAITFVNPTIMVASFQNTVSINGIGFETGAKVKLGDTNLQVTATASTSISAQYPSGFNPGLYDVTVVNPDGGQFTFPGAITIRPEAQVTQTNSILTTAQIVSKVSPSVVLVRTNLGCGSGMVMGSDGYILTNEHVIDAASTFTVLTQNGFALSAYVVGKDVSEDLALLKVDKTNLPTVIFGSSNDAVLPLGSNVVALGYPLTCNTDKTLEIEEGAITARRVIPGREYYGDLLQTSARINRGNSGGPLVNTKGEVVGVNTLVLATFGLNLSGIAFAIPSDTVQPYLKVLGLPYDQQSALTSPSPAPAPKPQPFGVISSGTAVNQFVIKGSGFCNGTGAAAIVLSGYPLLVDYSIPSLFVSSWTDSQITFTVPNSIPAAGTFSVLIQGDGRSGSLCPDIRVSGRATVQ